MKLAEKLSIVDDWLGRAAELPTPSLVIDLGRARRNIARLAAYAEQHHVAVRPHTKTHKSRELAALQIAAGARGLTAAKVGEAERMAEVDEDILVAYPAFDPHRAPRLAQLARGRTVRVAVDSAEGIERLAEAARSAGTTIGILVDLDVGLHRTGVATPAEALALAQRVDAATGVRLDGLFCYPGHIWGTPDSQVARLEAVDALLAETLGLWKTSGLSAPIVSGGSTPTAYRSHHCRSLTEIRPGTYIFNDRNTVAAGYCEWDDCAARVVCTVVSTAVSGQVVIDAGAKTLAADRCIPAPESGQGYVVEYPEAKITALSEEHGQVDVSACARRPRLGERLTVIPNHICPCVNLQESYWSLGPDAPPERRPVDTRGLLT